MTNILQKILARKETEVQESLQRRPLKEVRQLAEQSPPARDFLAPLRSAPPIRLIAEVKKASPSKGVIRSDFQPVELAKAYQAGGASCLSVLTDVDFFQGSLDYLSAIGQAVQLPLLRKDFIIHPYQVYEARAAGADAVLLIAECLEPEQLTSLYQLIRELGMAALIELYQHKNLDWVLNTGTPLIGINNRDLTTFHVDLQHTIRLRAEIPSDRIVVGESGIHSRSDALLLESHGVQAMLVGESLMRQDDVRAATGCLLGLKT
jgi:indole-3-glycerol phosphate synthase